jgi:hypothetical protein
MRGPDLRADSRVAVVSNPAGFAAPLKAWLGIRAQKRSCPNDGKKWLDKFGETRKSHASVNELALSRRLGNGFGCQAALSPPGLTLL